MRPAILFAICMTFTSLEVIFSLASQPLGSPTKLKPKLGKRLVTSPMTLIRLPSLIRCLDNCMYYTNCLSVNYVREDELCELLSENSTSVLTQNGLTMETDQPGYVHVDISEWLQMRSTNPCSSRPCDADFSCAPHGNTAVCQRSDHRLNVTFVESAPTAVSDTTAEFAGISSKTDVVIILQQSSYVGEENFQKMLDFAWALINSSDVDSGKVQFGLMTYAQYSTIQWQLQSYSSTSLLQLAVYGVPYNGGIEIAARALKKMNDVMFTAGKGDRPDAPNVCIFVTAKESSSYLEDTAPEARRARDDGMRIYAVGIGLPNTTEMDSVASEPLSENAFYLENYDELIGLETQIHP